MAASGSPRHGSSSLRAPSTTTPCRLTARSCTSPTVPGPLDARYQVRAVETATGRMRNATIVDKRNIDEEMAGWPVDQRRRADGMVMTLYRGAAYPFVHALSRRRRGPSASTCRRVASTTSRPPPTGASSASATGRATSRSTRRSGSRSRSERRPERQAERGLRAVGAPQRSAREVRTRRARPRRSTGVAAPDGRASSLRARAASSGSAPRTWTSSRLPDGHRDRWADPDAGWHDAVRAHPDRWPDRPDRCRDRRGRALGRRRRLRPLARRVPLVTQRVLTRFSSRPQISGRRLDVRRPPEAHGDPQSLHRTRPARDRGAWCRGLHRL